MPNMAPDILVFDGHQPTVAKILAELEPLGFVVASAPEPGAWVPGTSTLPEVMLFACRRHDISMHRVCREVKQASPEVAVFGYHEATMDEGFRVLFMEAGADDLLDLPGVVRTLRTTRVPRHGRGAHSRRTAALTMRVADGELPHIMQFLAGGGRCGELTLRFEHAAHTGTVAFADGRVRHAESGGKTGIEAMVDMMFRGAAEAEFHEGEPVAHATIGLPLDKMLLTVAWMFDEEAERRRLA